MTKYQLAKLVMMAGTLESRKRAQKTVHLLQAAGCDFGAEFRLHYYGPYSPDIAGLLDEMTEGGILDETAQSFVQGTQYNYSLSDEFRESLERHEQTPSGQKAKAEIEEHGDLFGELCQRQPKTLELASTMVFFRQCDQEWAEAIEQTRRFKNEDANSQRMKDAELLARKITP